MQHQSNLNKQSHNHSWIYQPNMKEQINCVLMNNQICFSVRHILNPKQLDAQLHDKESHWSHAACLHLLSIRCIQHQQKSLRLNRSPPLTSLHWGARFRRNSSSGLEEKKKGDTIKETATSGKTFGEMWGLEGRRARFAAAAPGTD